MTTPIPSPNHPDVLLIGAGIMSATRVVILKELDPSLKLEVCEVLGSEAQESSNAWKPFREEFHRLFNSYYLSLGEKIPEKKLRASFSRPSLDIGPASQEGVSFAACCGVKG
jgi:hypothetical protein